MNEFPKHLPKTELHAHLNGSLSAETLKKLGSFDESIERYQKLNGLLERNSRTLDECFHLFKVAHDVTVNKQAVYTATRDVIQDFFNDNVIYLELRTTPRAEVGMNKREYIEAVVQAIQDNQLNILVKLLLCIDRRHEISVSKGVLDLIIEMKNKYPHVIKGIDLCGNPNVGIFNAELFIKARENGLMLSIHGGEIKNDEEVEEIFKLKPERIGHGTCIHPNFGGSEALWNLYKQIKIPIEMCLTSNVICGTSEGYKAHHVSEWLKNDLPFSIATDDKGVFNTTLSKEYALLQEHFNLKEQELWNITFNSIDHSFADNIEKENLRSILLDWKTKHMK
ncbi:putative deaminase [Trypoxylus dichotomus]